jgi:hypothetical protein
MKKLSVMIKGSHMGEMSNLGWLIGLVRMPRGPIPLFCIPAVTFNFQNHGFIPAYPMTFFIGMMAIWNMLRVI